jgi:rhomboid family GlyGly-CTERM serine protease
VPCSADHDARRHGRLGWSLVAALLLLPSLLVAAQASAAALLAWEPGRAAAEPWRFWSAAWVHLSALHLQANLAGGALVLALGWAARVPPRAALAWALAWPLTHLGLLLMPELTRYGGLSGVLHAGVAVAGVVLLRRATRAERRLGAVVLAVLLLKLLLETPWRGPLAYPAGWDIAVAPLAHATGALSGALLAWALVARDADGG